MDVSSVHQGWVETAYFSAYWKKKGSIWTAEGGSGKAYHWLRKSTHAGENSSEGSCGGSSLTMHCSSSIALTEQQQ
jgi:hypothetical protein